MTQVIKRRPTAPTQPDQKTPEAEDILSCVAFSVARVRGGYALVKLRIAGDRVVDVTIGEADTKGQAIDQFKVAAAKQFIIGN